MRGSGSIEGSRVTHHILLSWRLCLQRYMYHWLVCSNVTLLTYVCACVCEYEVYVVEGVYDQYKPHISYLLRNAVVQGYE